MKKLIIKFLFLYLLFFNSALSEIVNKIEISGNKRISNETIKVLGQISKGKNLNDSDLNKILKELYETDFFSDVQIF